jgi:hypothetical protein
MRNLTAATTVYTPAWTSAPAASITKILPNKRSALSGRKVDAIPGSMAT